MVRTFTWFDSRLIGAPEQPSFIRNERRWRGVNRFDQGTMMDALCPICKLNVDPRLSGGGLPGVKRNRLVPHSYYSLAALEPCASS